MSFQSEFVNPMLRSRRFQEWQRDSPGDDDRFFIYADKIARGIRPTIPEMRTQFGKALIGAGKPWLPPAAPPPVPPPPVVSASVFAGRGGFCAWDWTAALPLRGVLRWVAVQAEGRHDGGAPWVTRENVAQLRAAGFDVHVWEANVNEGQAAVDRLGATGWIGQAESRPQLDASLAVGANVRAPKALIAQPGAMDTWPQGYEPIVETYWNADLNQSPENQNYEAYKRGARRIKLCYGAYDATMEQPPNGRRVLLRDYEAAAGGLGLDGESFYLCETLDPRDVGYLQGFKR